MVYFEPSDRMFRCHRTLIVSLIHCRDSKSLEDSQKHIEVDVTWPDTMLMTASLLTVPVELDGNWYLNPGTSRGVERLQSVTSAHKKTLTSA